MAQDIEEMLDQFEQQVEAREEAARRNTQAATELASACQAIFSSDKGRKVLSFLKASYLQPLSEAEQKQLATLPAEVASKVLNKREGRAEVVRCIMSAAEGRVRPAGG